MEKEKQEFLTLYKRLCEEMGLELIARPAFAQRDDGTFSVVIKWDIVPRPKIEEPPVL